MSSHQKKYQCFTPNNPHVTRESIHHMFMREVESNPCQISR
jgi:hypothetical protein